jgi:hypothetical protein
LVHLLHSLYHDTVTQKNLQDVFKKPPTSDEAPAAHLEDVHSFVSDLFGVNADSGINLVGARPLRPAISNLNKARLWRTAVAARM